MKVEALGKVDNKWEILWNTMNRIGDQPLPPKGLHRNIKADPLRGRPAPGATGIDHDPGIDASPLRLNLTYPPSTC